MLIDGVMLLWFALTALSVAFGAFLYVLGSREPLPGLHERGLRKSTR